MKDAGGHGSNPRGEQNAGVENAVKFVYDPVTAAAEAEARARFLNPAKMVPLDSVHPTKQRDLLSLKNKTDDEANIAQLRDTIRQGHGDQIPPLYVSGKNRDVIDGNHRYYAFKEEGVKMIPVQTRSRAGMKAISNAHRWP
jgi:hypothetical protein